MSYNRRTLSPDSPYAILAAALMFLSAAILTVFYACNSFSAIWLPGVQWLEIVSLYLLPVSGSIIMAMMLVTRKNNLMPTIYPIVMVAVFCALKSAFSLNPIGCIINCVMYTLFASVYILTVSGVLNTRFVLIGLAVVMALLTMSSQAFALDISSVIQNNKIISSLPDVSTILILVALIVETIGMRRGRLY